MRRADQGYGDCVRVKKDEIRKNRSGSRAEESRVGGRGEEVGSKGGNSGRG